MAKKIVTADRRRQAKKLGLHFLEGLAGLAAVCACVIAFYMWQYSSGSLSLNAISPNIKDAIAKSARSVDVDFSQITFHRPIGGNLATVLIKDVSIKAAAQGIDAQIPEAAVSFEMSSLAKGTLRPHRVVLRGGGLNLNGPEGTPDKVTSDPSSAQPLISDLLAAVEETLTPLLFRDIHYADTPDHVAGALRHITMTDFVVDMAETGAADEVRLEISKLTFDDRSSAAEILGQANFVALGETTPVELRMLRADYESPADVSVSVAAFPIHKLLSLVNQEWGSRIDIAGAFQSSSALSPSGKLIRVDAKVSAREGKIDLSGIQLGQDDAPVDGDPLLDAMQPDVELPQMGVVDIETAELAVEFDRLTGTGHLHSLRLTGGETDLNFSGRFGVASLQGDPVDTWDSMDLMLHAENASLQVDGFYEEVVNFASFDLSANFDRRRKSAQITRFETTLDGSVIAAEGTMDFSQVSPPPVVEGVPANGAPAVRVTGKLSNVKIATVVKLWPAPVAMGARDWIRDYVDAGIIPSADFEMRVPAGYLGTAPLQNEMLSLAFDFTGGRAHYIPGLTPLSNAAGSGKLSGNRFDLELNSGTVGSIRAHKGTIVMPRLVPKGATSEFRATISGAASEILTLIDMEPLRLMSKFGMDPKTIGGNATTEFVIGRPNRRVVPVEMITYRAEARGKQLSIRQAVGGLDLTDGALNLLIEPAGIQGAGSLSVAGVPAKFEWQERFGLDGAAPPTEYKLDIDTTSEQLVEAGFAVGDMVSGPIKAKISTKGKGVEISQAIAHVNLAEAAVDFETMNWLKPQGEPADLRLELETPFRNGTIEGPSDVRVSLQGYQASVHGQLRLAQDFKLLSASIPALTLGTQTNCSIALTRLPSNNGLRVNVTGDALNAASFIRSFFEGSQGSLDAPIDLNADLDRVWLNDGVVADDFKLSFVGDGSAINDMNLEAQLPDENKVFAWLTDRTDTQKQMTLSTTNAGMLIKGVTGNASIIGGTIDLDAFINTEMREGTDPVQRVHGTLNARNFQIINMPVLGRLLQAGSLQGLNNLLNGEGLEFGRLDMEFDSHDGIYVIQDGQISGPSLGLTAKGTYDRNQSEMNINGTLVPIYSVNRLFGVVPGINRVLASREGEGLLGFTYQIKGSPDKARISVNPLSALAPGFLRRLFQLGSDRQQAEALLSANSNTADAVSPLAGAPAEPAAVPIPRKKKSKRDGETVENPVVDLVDQKTDAILFDHALEGTVVVPKPKPAQRKK